MIKKTFIIAALGLSVQLQASASEVSVDTLTKTGTQIESEMLRTIEPTYLKEVSVPSAWSSNWFVGVSGGASAFLGKPLGCEDIFGRTMPSLAVSLGKWFTPEVGGRISYQGFKFKDYNIEKHGYSYIHADFLWNVASVFSKSSDLRKWNVIPFAGAGIVHHEDNGNTPFALSYGIIGQYRLSRRALVSMELGNMTTFQTFDGVGKTNRFGDNMLTLSAGITYHIGRVGYNRVVDASPYMTQNKWLMDYVNQMIEKNRQLNRIHEKDAIAIAELRKILEIEGLMDLYGDQLASLDDGETVKGYPKNDYSGLNSLRARLAHKDWDGQGKLKERPSKRSLSYQVSLTDSLSSNSYISELLGGKVCIGAPVHFYFKLGTSELTNAAQMTNLDELSRVAKKYGLKVSVIGSADSATGTTGINNSLSAARAEYILSQLKKRGVDSSIIRTSSKGGIDKYKPIPANRQVAVCLYL